MKFALRHLASASPRHGRMKHRTRRLRPIRSSRATELWYRARLMAIVEAVIAIVDRSGLTQVLRPYALTDSTVAVDAGGWNTIQRILNRLTAAVSGLREQADDLAAMAVRRNLRGVDERLVASVRQSLQINIGSILVENFELRSAMQRAALENSNLITSIPDQYLERVRAVIEKNMADGLRWESLIEDLQDAGEMTKTRAKIIARDQTNKMNGAFNQVRQQSLGIERYEWQTSGDEAVRETHEAHDGKVYRWDDPPEDTGHPGEDILCRCVAIPLLDLDEPERELE